MNKKIISVALCLFMLCAFLVLPEASAIEDPVIYDGENITVKTTLDAPAGTPVLVIVTKPDITITQLQTAAPGTISNFVDFMDVCLLTDAAVNLQTTIPLNAELSTGVCEVGLAYLGQPAQKLGEFENLNRQAIGAMVNAFNGATYDPENPETYAALFTTAPDALRPTETYLWYLEKLGANTTAFNNLSSKNAFYAYLSGKKPFAANAAEGKTAAKDLIDKFDVGIAFGVLSETTDVLGTLGEYNGVAWNLDLAPGSDFDNLSLEQKNSILSAIDDGTYTDASTLEADFKTPLAIYMFLGCTIADDVASVISSSYNEIYELDLDLLSNPKLNDYYRTVIYNAMVAGKNSVSNVATLQTLYTTAVNQVLNDIPDEKEDDDDRPGRVGSVGVTIPNTKPDKTETKPVAFFGDVPANHWAYGYIKNMFEQNIVSGRTAKEFAPDAPVKREEFVKIMALALKLGSSSSASSFTDVEAGSWYQPYVAAAVDAGLVNGVSGDAFGVGRELTRQDAAVIIERVLQKQNITLQDGEASFADMDKVSSYAKSAVSKMAAVGLIQGNIDNTFLPKNSISRAEVCALLDRMLELMEGVESNV